MLKTMLTVALLLGAAALFATTLGACTIHEEKRVAQPAPVVAPDTTTKTTTTHIGIGN